MATKHGNGVLQVIRTLARKHADDQTPDRELLQRFVDQRDEEAFAVLVRRYGSMVMGVGLRLLHNHQDAEDVCQATFLLLARKADTTTWRDSVGNWLYEVAYRVAQDALKAARRRKIHEGNRKLLPAPDPLADITLRELQGLLDEEVTRLPKKYRMPLILCCLEDKARDEVARSLGVPLATVKSRLEEGRELLRRRLAGRGVQLSLALASLTLLAESARAAVPAALVNTTCSAALSVLTGHLTSKVVSVNVLTLFKGGIQTMFLTKLKIATAAVLLVASVAVGAGGLLYQTQAAESPKAQRAIEPKIDKSNQPAAGTGDDKKAEDERKVKTKKVEKMPGVVHGVIDQVDAKKNVITVTLPGVRRTEDGRTVITGESIRLENLPVSKSTKITVDGKNAELAEVNAKMIATVELEVTFGRIGIKRLEAKDAE